MTISKKKLSLLALCSFVVGSNFSAIRAEVMEEVTTGEMGVMAAPGTMGEEPMVLETKETFESEMPVVKKDGRYGSKKVKTKTTKKGPVRAVASAPFEAVRKTTRKVTGRDATGKKTTRTTKRKTEKTELKKKPKKSSMKKGGCPCPRSVQESYDFESNY